MAASFLGLIYQTTLFVQQVHGYSPLAAGASTVPIAVLSLLVSARVAPPLIQRIGAARTLAAGMGVLAIGLLLLTHAPANGTYLQTLLPAYCLVGIGIGMAQVASQIAAFTGVSGEGAGLAGGALETAREFGGALGLAALTGVRCSAGARGGLDGHRRRVGSAPEAGHVRLGGYRVG